MRMPPRDMTSIERNFARIEPYMGLSWLQNEKGSGQAPVFVCLDFVRWEKNSELILEIGITTLDTAKIPAAERTIYENWAGSATCQHILIQEYAMLVNKGWWRNKGCPEDFIFGHSTMRSLKDAAQIVLAAICRKDRPVVLVSQDSCTTMICLDRLIEGFDSYERLNRPFAGTINVRGLCTYWCPPEDEPKISDLLRYLKLRSVYLQNAGNRALYVLDALLAQWELYKNDRAALEKIVKRVN